ncbi:hypothetical protein [Burkholderia sp. WAC0059]|uniref:hypothetical protein n=1 Tax=Burkholderia sp. WAC0059 TaxID=2066022 RepID=UPI0011AF0061|nr:hypothetical protein [Burkholderia sp. WAC0059]
MLQEANRPVVLRRIPTAIRIFLPGGRFVEVVNIELVHHDRGGDEIERFCRHARLEHPPRMRALLGSLECVLEHRDHLVRNEAPPQEEAADIRGRVFEAQGTEEVRSVAVPDQLIGSEGRRGQ